MATQIFLNGKAISQPGVYSTIKSGVRNPSIALSFGNTLVIDTGSGLGWGGGSGVNGVLKQGKDSVYTFGNVRDFRTFIRGGLHWFLSGPMFLPGGGATQGISSLTYLRAATTIPAQLALEFGDFASDVTNNGSITLQLRDEGFVGNGVLGDETRAQATITVTNAGSAGDTISVTIEGITVGTYTVQTGDNIQAVVNGLKASIAALSIADIVSSNASQIVIYAPHGRADAINGVSPLVIRTGTVNGVASSFAGGAEGTILTRGIAAKIIAGVNDNTKFIVQFWRGTFKGTDELVSSGTPYDGIAEIGTKAELIAQSPEINTVTALLAWMNDTTGKGYVFNQYFKVLSSTIATVDEIVTEDITPGYIKASGGSETFSTDDLTDALESIEGNFDFILADNWGDSARSAKNLAILEWIINTAKIKPDMYVAVGQTVGEFSGASTSSVSVAQAYDSQYVTVVHGGVQLTDVGGRSLKDYDSIVHAAYLLGREAGLEPQIPLTFKNIGIQGELHALKDKEVNQGLDIGVLMTRIDSGSFEVVKGVNTLQNNSFLVNPDGSTHSKQLGRIIRQLNKEITVNAKQQLLKKPNGANRNTVSPEDVKAWLEGYLNSKVATDTQDNLLISFSNISVSITGDAYEITYSFVPSFEVSFLVFSGTLIDPAS